METCGFRGGDFPWRESNKKFTKKVHSYQQLDQCSMHGNMHVPP